jgi:8-amino-7-oxononanoate synthase
MGHIAGKLQQELEKRKRTDSLRQLQLSAGLIDFCSNDYLGFAQSEELYHAISEAMSALAMKSNGATGSRLISGNNEHVVHLEDKIAHFFNGEAALFFNSGYSANQSILSAIPQRGDTIIYDELVHASIKDGMRLSFANKVSFKHNNTEDLERKLSTATGDTYVVVESIYSMDGDISPLRAVAAACDQFQAYLIIDEAHSVGVTGDQGTGLCVAEEILDLAFARIYTFGKALGVHGACVVGSASLKEYLINFSRPFIYTTALPVHSIVSVSCALDHLAQANGLIAVLQKNIDYFRKKMKHLENDLYHNGLRLIESQTAIQGVVIAGNEAVRAKSESLQNKGLDVRPIRSPTVKIGTERLRICLHAFNTPEEIDLLVETILES